MNLLPPRATWLLSALVLAGTAGITATAGCTGPAAPPPGADAATDATRTDAPMDDASAVDAAVDGAAADAPVPSDAGFEETRRVLFVGNSYTYTNDLPAVIVALAGANGMLVEPEVIAPPGAKFCDHIREETTRDRIASEDHDAVVIQGQSVDMFYDAESALGCAQSLSYLARDAGADLLWFATWARREGDEFYTRGRGVTNPAEMTERIDGFYEILSTFGVESHVARVGRAWERILGAMPGLALHEPDGSHPSPLGTFVAACTFTHALLGRVPDLPSPIPFGLDPELARTVCTLATEDTCFDDLEFCDGRCISVYFDETHCGACDNACGPNHDCWRNVCECAPGFPSANLEALEALDPTCDASAARPSLTCDRAAHAACVDEACGGTGFLVHDNETEEARAQCTAPAAIVATTYEALALEHARCDGVIESQGDACRTAAHRTCLALGHAAGLGPISVEGDTVEIACLDGATVTFFFEAAIHAWGCEGWPDREWDATCDEVVSRRCGEFGGYGPIESTERTDGVDIVCLTR